MKTVSVVVLLCFFLLVNAVDAADDWTQQSPSSNPSARYSHAMSYIDSNQALLFGGYTSSLNDETWLYNLSDHTWTQHSPSSKPSARRDHTMAYIGGDRALLFGGNTGVFNNGTWVYDLSDSNWTQKNPSSKPSARVYHAMAYIGDDRALLFGGFTGSYNNETWVYDRSDNNWTQKNPSSKPSARMHHAMAYIGGDRALLFGGFDSAINNETWVYDRSDNNWTQKNPSSKPSARRKHAMAYIGGDRVLLFGGDDGDYDGETWVYDLSDDNWTQDANTSQPSARYDHGLSETSMDGSSYLLLFGGFDSVGNDDETWTFGGGDYSLPVELSSFNALSEAGKVILSWRTESEVNNVGFSIYRSEEKDGNYIQVTFVKGAGNSSAPRDYQFVDQEVEMGKTYFYYLEDVDVAGEKNRYDIIELVVTPAKILKVVVPPAKSVQLIPKEFRLLQNFPNPFNPETWLPYELASDAEVNIDIYNFHGQLVRQLNLGNQEAGSYLTKDKAAYWDGKNKHGQKLASGVYWYTLRAGEFKATRRMVIFK